MQPARQLIALHNNKEWLHIIQNCERVQAAQDVRLLRKAGITSVGEWKTHEVHVTISDFSRGLLHRAFYTITKQPQ